VHPVDGDIAELPFRMPFRQRDGTGVVDRQGDRKLLARVGRVGVVDVRDFPKTFARLSADDVPQLLAGRGIIRPNAKLAIEHQPTP
jgi:hypothetical protein